MKIGIFGGSFNPCHVEHEAMARAMVSELALDKLIIVPAGVAPHKKNQQTISAVDKLNILTLAFSGDEKIVVSDYELEKEGVSYTYQTILKFAEEYEGSEIFFLVGTDMLYDFTTWMKPETILSYATLCVVAREGEDVSEAERTYYSHFSKPIVRLKYCGSDVSSTAIRASACLSLPLDEYVDKAVGEYIEKHNLYKNQYSKFVTENLPIKRLTHTFGVMTLAVRYAKRLKINSDEAFVAAMLHDAAKYLDPKDYGCVIDDDVPAQVVHQFLGAFIAEKVLGVTNADILNAVRYHTTGRPEMSALEKVVFLADLLEKGRAFDGVERLRNAVDEDFEKGFKTCLDELYKFLCFNGQPVYHLTKDAHEFYCGGNNR